jgi:3-hydroxybutyryl-CoA dehydrogenase
MGEVSLQIKTPYSIRLGVVGAGTMGSGIALTALYAGMLVTLYDIAPEFLERAREYIQGHLQRKNQEIRLKNLSLTTDLEELRGAGVVIEAVPEDLTLKQNLFSRLDEICPPPTVLASNTSTLPLTALAAATHSPERVAGMHFFNPAPVLPLVEVVRAAQSGESAIQDLVDLANILGKTAVVANDTPGFIVNRVARPFYGEALRLVAEKVATFRQVDQLVRLGGGFRMGPFELMDLIGIDVNLAAMQSMYDQTYGEPRYRPNPIQARMVQQKTLGCKTGRGFYVYTPAPESQECILPEPRQQKGVVRFSSGNWAPGVLKLYRKAGYSTSDNNVHRPEKPVIGIVRAGRGEHLERLVVIMDGDLPPDVPLLCQCVDVTLTEIATWVRRPERLVGFDGLFLSNGPMATLVPSPTLNPFTRTVVDEFFKNVGYLTTWITDSPGLVLPRIVGMLANEAAFAAGEGVADFDTIDKAMQLGTNYPHGPLAWAKGLGFTKVVNLLDHLHREFGEERYRVAPLLRRWSRLEQVTA